MVSFKRMIAAVMLLSVLLCTAPVSAFADNYKNELLALEMQYDELEKQRKEIDTQINKAKSEKDKQLAAKNQLDNQIYSVRQQINILSEKIGLLEDEIEVKQDELARQENAIRDNYELLKKRLRVMYKTGNATVLGLILGADSFTEFLTHTQVTSRVAQHDRELIEEMTVRLSEIKQLKEGIEADKTELESSKSQQADKQTVLAGQLEIAKHNIQDIEQLEKQFQSNRAALTKQMQEVQAEVDAIYSKINSEGEYDGGIMLWPVAGYKTVTSDYGWRFGGTDFHTGIDIARTNAAGQGIYGKPILAADDGKVVFTQTNYVPGRGYGIYCIVDHGGGVTTLYGHSSGLAVKSGQTVKRGQTIAYVGSTGWSTGPHLHFEVRVNGTYTNPWPYLK